MQGRCWQAVDPLNLGRLSCVGLIARMPVLLCPGIKVRKLLGIHTWFDAAERLLEVSVGSVSHAFLRRCLNSISKLPATPPQGMKKS